MDALASLLGQIGDWITLYITAVVLAGAGIAFTIATRGVQFRLFRQMWKVVLHSRENARGGISSFQAFAISLAARVGIGNVFGVAVALLLGGPGAIFWMWIVALLGMATAFYEATTAQIFKVRSDKGTFVGGPAYYLSLGLKQKWLGVLFAFITVITCAFTITMLQANAISSTMDSYGVAKPVWTAIILAVLTALVVQGGIKSVARVTEILAPVMAGIYVLVALLIMLLNLSAVPEVFRLIFTSAFSVNPVVGGLGGGIVAAIINGTKRGLFSNEAGQGTAPNAAATANASHPVQQGLIQSLGVFLDTIVVCSATAFVILLAGKEVWEDPQSNPATLTTAAIASLLGSGAIIPMTIMIFVLAFSSIIAAYVYSEVNLRFFTNNPQAIMAVRVVSVVSVVLGCLAPLPIVWNTVDIAMAIMTLVNLVGLLGLMPWAAGALRDYEQQLKSGNNEPVFVGKNNSYLPSTLPTDIWQ
ncbi:alanine/glycine:cation symporter family protein [Boudabousia tangfeifanii]|uniref:alanine/glycine:cation symporter family protein n=1 Tax=Boudabousia tangfeifanii TaxID=1912795 RepID=UPI000A98C2D2|nr:alanine/glycine:cation symporter family protein [Boudabousia tangfeifanii]